MAIKKAGIVSAAACVCVAVCCSVMQCVMQCVAVCCSVMHCDAV